MEGTNSVRSARRRTQVGATNRFSPPTGNSEGNGTAGHGHGRLLGRAGCTSNSVSAGHLPQPVSSPIEARGDGSDAHRIAVSSAPTERVSVNMICTDGVVEYILSIQY